MAWTRQHSLNFILQLTGRQCSWIRVGSTPPPLHQQGWYLVWRSKTAGSLVSSSLVPYLERSVYIHKDSQLTVWRQWRLLCSWRGLLLSYDTSFISCNYLAMKRTLATCHNHNWSQSTALHMHVLSTTTPQMHSRQLQSPRPQELRPKPYNSKISWRQR